MRELEEEAPAPMDDEEEATAPQKILPANLFLFGPPSANEWNF